MNFQDLYKKIRQLDEQDMPISEPAPTGDAPPPPADTAAAPAPSGEMPSDVSVEECGGDMMPRPTMAPKQSDSVTMSVSMNGSGKGGIRDLMDVLKNIESGAGHDDDKLFGKASAVDVHDEPIMGDEYANSVDGGSDAEVYGIDAVTGTGDDLHSKGKEAEKVNGGGNPFTVDEALVDRLSNLYSKIKGEPKEKEVDEGMWDTVAQGAKAAVQGAQQLGQQAVQGVQNVANTVANTSVGDAAKAVGQAGLAQAKALANPAAAAAGVMKQAGDAVTNARNAVGQKIATAAQGAVQGAQQLAQQAGQKVASAVAPKQAGGFDTMPDNMTMANPTGAAPTTSAPQLNPKLQATASQLSPGMANAFESSDVSDIRKLAGL